MLFKNVIGQNIVKQKLISIVRQNRLSHAMLFTGKQGVGKLPLAIALTQYISCTDKKNNDACNNCNSCIKYNKLVHPDLHFSFPVTRRTGDSKEPTSDDYINEWRKFVLNNPYNDVNNWYKHIGIENKQGYFYTAESNRIIKLLSLKTYESDYKNLIIWLPEKMDAKTGNKLLKIIEEPYDKTCIIMVSEEPESILPTIVSRTQQIAISLIDAESMIIALKNKYPHIGEDSLKQVYHNSGGSFSEALKLIEETDEEMFEFEWFQEMIRNCYSGNIHKINDWVAKTAQLGREKQKSFLVYTLKMLRENFVYNHANTKINFLNTKEKEFTIKTAPFFKNIDIEKMYDECSSAYNHIMRNANPKILFFDFSLKMVKLFRQV